MLPPISWGHHLHAYTIESFKNLISLFKELRLEKIEVILDGWSFGGILKKE
jgi:hypothetical protein